MAAWTQYYKLGLKGGNDPVGWAILAIKAEVVYNGIPQGGLEMSTPEYGTGTEKKVKEFQTKYGGLEVDGIVGPKTAHALWMKRTKFTQVKYNIPGNILCKTKTLESQDDPAAIGSVDPHDRGLMQINSVSHPTVTDQMAFMPSFAIEWAGQYFNLAFLILGDWTLATVSYNVGTAGARAWDKAGRPKFKADGTPTTAAKYLEVVTKQVC